MKLQVHGETALGNVRQRNEDNLLVDTGHAVFAVADGVGGMPGGEIASSTAIETIRKRLATDASAALADFPELVQQAHRAVRHAGRPYGAGIATTLTIAHIAGGRAKIAHVGDSFAMLVRDGKCRPITREHNVENEHHDIESLAPYPPRYRFALTRVIGQIEPLEVEIFEQDLEPGDWLILATDGLTDLVEFREIPELCTGGTADACRQLVEEALARGGNDNITLIAVKVQAL